MELIKKHVQVIWHLQQSVESELFPEIHFILLRVTHLQPRMNLLNPSSNLSANRSLHSFAKVFFANSLFYRFAKVFYRQCFLLHGVCVCTCISVHTSKDVCASLCIHKNATCNCMLM